MARWLCHRDSSPIDLHLKGFEAAKIQAAGYVEAQADKLVGASTSESVGATENIMMAAVLI